MRSEITKSMRCQYFLGQIGILLIAPLNVLFIRTMRYKIRDLKRLRKTCFGEFAKHNGPWIICANHLTMVDSMILTYAMFSLLQHFFHFRWIPWNLPERDNFQRNRILAVFCYLAKCIPVNRGGNREEMKRSLDRCDAVLAGGQNLLIFPEGGRSRMGRINKKEFSYGVGRFIKEFSDCRILCIYLRGDEQKSFGTIPRFRERFTMAMKILEPHRPAFNGLRIQREYAGQIIECLAEMEEEYFERLGGSGRQIRKDIIFFEEGS